VSRFRWPQPLTELYRRFERQDTEPESTDRMSGSIELIYLIGGW